MFSMTSIGSVARMLSRTSATLRSKFSRAVIPTGLPAAAKSSVRAKTATNSDSLRTRQSSTARLFLGDRLARRPQTAGFMVAFTNPRQRSCSHTDLTIAA